nr:PAS domain-containing protein [Kordiimonas laminariae]
MFKRTPKSMFLERIWRDLPRDGGRDMPLRNTLKASRIPDLIPDLSVAKLLDDSVRVIMAGTNVTARLEAETAGKDYMQFVSASQRQDVLTTLQLVCGMPVGACLQIRSSYHRGYDQTVEVTILPLAGLQFPDVYVMALSVPINGSRDMQGGVRGAPVAADWSGPVQWIDLGLGVPQLDGGTQADSAYALDISKVF